MEVITLTIFVSLCLVACGLLLLAVTLRQRTPDHAERLALLPMDEERDALLRVTEEREPISETPKRG